MQNTYLLIAAASALTAGLPGLIFTNKKGLAIVVGILTFFVNIGWMNLVSTFTLPVYTHWLQYGWLWLISFIVGLVIALLHMASEYEQDAWGSSFSLVGVIIIVIAFLWGGVQSNPDVKFNWPFCQSQPARDMVNLYNINLQETPVVLNFVDPNNEIQVSPTMAKTWASDIVDTDYSTYMGIGAQNYVEVAGVPYLVVSLNVTNYTGFKNFGDSKIPGYFLVRADKKNSGAQFIPYPMIVSQTLEETASLFDRIKAEDLDRIVYTEELFPKGENVLDIGSLELDDQMGAHYTGLLTKPLVGSTGTEAVGYIIVDPTNKNVTVYEITHKLNAQGQMDYDTSKVPAWVDTVFPEEYFNSVILEWATYSEHVPCQSNGGKTKQYNIDRKEDVLTKEGDRIYQFSLTSFQESDSAMSYLLYANPRTGAVIGYKTSGEYALPIIEDVEANFIEAANNNLHVENAAAEETQVTYWAGIPVFTTILTKNVDGQVNFVGYGVVPAVPALARDSDNYIIEPSPQQAYATFIKRLASFTGKESDRSAPAQTVQTTGIVVKIGMVDPATNQFVLVVQANGTHFWFLVTVDTYTSVIAVGDTVTVTSQQIDPTSVNMAITVTDHTLQPILPPTATTPPQ